MNSLEWMSFKAAFYFAAGFCLVAALIVIGYYLKLRSERPISVSEFRHRLRKLL